MNFLIYRKAVRTKTLIPNVKKGYMYTTVFRLESKGVSKTLVTA